ncbi:MAG: hypothetical protein Q8K86_05020 [Candidatus Nanopelagicaceae bacterium]|nr:hypothetical protein [Candidatus Nanopelagicaceae bacterium]
MMKFLVRVKDGNTITEFKIEAETADEARRIGLGRVYGDVEETGFEPEEAELACVIATPLFPIETFTDPDVQRRDVT